MIMLIEGEGTKLSKLEINLSRVKLSASPQAPKPLPTPLLWASTSVNLALLFFFNNFIQASQ